MLILGLLELCGSAWDDEVGVVGGVVRRCRVVFLVLHFRCLGFPCELRP